MGESRPNELRFIAIATVLAAAIFLLDLSLPLGAAGGVPYVALVLLGWWSSKPRYILLFATVSTVLTVTGYFYSPEGGIQWVVLTNRFLAFFAIWVTAALLTKVKGAELALQIAHKQLEQQAEAALRDTKEWYRTIVNYSPTKIHIKDMEGRYLLVNKKAEALFGVTDEEARGKTTFDLFPEAQAEDFLAHDKAVVETGQAIEHEEEFVREDGVHTFLTVKFPIHDGAGKIVATGAIGTDITERKRAQKALEQLKQQNELLLSSAGEGIYGLDTQGRTTFINPAAAMMIGWKVEELIGKPQHDILHHTKPDGSLYPREECPIYTAFKDGSVHHVTDEVFWRKDGSSFPVEYVSTPIRERGEITGAVVVFRDITERKRAEELSQRLGRIVEDSTNEIYVFDSTTLRFIQVNRGARENTGYSMDELRAMTPFDLKPEFTIGEFRKLIRPLKHGDKDHIAFETVHQRKDGSKYDVEVRLQLAATETPPVYFAIIRDVTERKRTEAQLHQAQKMEVVGQLTGGVAHDFNNLLTVVLGNLELLRDQTEEREIQHRFIDSAIRATERGAMLTGRLLAFSRKQTLHPKGLDLNELVAGMSDMLQRTLGETIVIEAESADSLWPVFADPVQMESALLNLALNARDAMPKGGNLTIETANIKIDDEYVAANADVGLGEYVLLSVSDTGIGMSPEDVHRAFEPFFTTKEVGEGSGLGLSMVYGFAKQSGGHISIHSDEGHGTTVKLYLPRANQVGLEAEPNVAPELHGAQEETILVVEDDPDVRTLAVALLGDLGYEVLEASDGASAITALKCRSQIDLLLTDVILAGGMSGPELAEEAKRIQPAMRILFMSGYPREAMIHRGELEQNADLLNKPFRKADLAQKIRGALWQAAPVASDSAA